MKYFERLWFVVGACSHIDCSDVNEDDGETTDVSLITGALRSSGFSSLEPKNAVPGSAVVQKSQTLMLAQANTAGLWKLKLHICSIRLISVQLN